MDYSQKSEKEYQNSRKQDTPGIYIYKNELGKACFQHDIAYRNRKDLPKRIASNKVFCDMGFGISNLKYDGYQRGIASVVYKFFDKKAGDTITHTGT